MTDHTAWKLNKETQAARVLREALGAGTGDAALFDDDAIDEQLVRDSIEGETDLHEMIAATIASMDEDSVLIAGLQQHMDAMKQRLDRFKKRLEAKRAAIEQAMVIGELKTLEIPTCTATLRRLSPGMQITDEARIPAGYWKAKDPVLDKVALKKALKDGSEIPGCGLDNGGVSLQIRRN